MLAIVAALICFALRLKGEMGIAAAFVIYAASFLAFRYGLKYSEEQLKGKYRSASLGSGTFIFVWAAIWILLFTLSPY